MIRDRDGAFGPAYTQRVRAMGIRDRPIAPRSPWQNGYAERLMGSLRRECTDHLIVFSEAHLRRTLKTYASYYNQVRTHLALDKDAPDFRRRQLLRNITALPVLGGLLITTSEFEFSIGIGSVPVAQPLVLSKNGMDNPYLF